MRKCLIIEDDVETAAFVAKGLREKGYAVTLCRDGVDGLQRATTGTWDVIVLDRMLPDKVDGLSILSTLRGLGRRVPVLILSALSGIDERVRGLESGCDDYLSKPFAFSEFAARIEALIRRSQVDESVHELRIADLQVDLIARRVERGGVQIPLQPREFRLLVYLLSRQGQVVTRTMLLESVWDYSFDPHTNLIDVHISRLRTKLEKNFGVPLIHTVRGVGYVMMAEVPESSYGQQ
ncbi:response regulator transcription factor [Steroidobacter cummioxidans]|uniref:response regulator transcription factor n=1 Tax=Steroidobacter cummioxidans TaxID=1803913 RepID=UPI000E30EB65|nr:response regulator transcription factor [Steroidobacter cummioxidans]